MASGIRFLITDDDMMKIITTVEQKNPNPGPRRNKSKGQKNP